MPDLRLSLVIPAHNEEETIAHTIFSLEQTLRAAAIPHEILVVDDHSTDRTVAVIEELQRLYPDVRVVRNERPNGFGHAVQTGIDHYQGDAFCLVMADGSDEPRDVVKMYEKLQEGYECVFGSRFISGGRVVNYPKHKLLLNRLVNWMIQLLFGLRYNDVTNAFKCYRRAVLEGIRPILSHHFNLTVEMPLKAIVRGFSYTVVPTSWYGRIHGVSKLRIREMGSRYLFIILYVLLEKLLSRGDYRRAAAARELAAGHGGPPGLKWAWLAFGAVVVMHLLFVKTFPLNDLGGDTRGYYWVLINRTSNLVFAPGYPFLAGLPLRMDWFFELAEKHPGSFRRFLLYEQHAFELFCLGVFMVAVARLYNRTTAAAAVLIAGCSARAMGITSAAYPEWLQSDLLLLSLALAVFAYKATGDRRKTVLYALSFAAFAWSYLVKFNAIALAPLFLPFVFAEGPWRRRAKIFLPAVAFGCANLLFFTAIFHRPVTGTWALTRDKSWVLMAKLQHVYDGSGPGGFPNQDGDATRRWLALSSVLPPNYSIAGVFLFLREDCCVEGREMRQHDAAFLMTASDEVVDGILQLHPLPPSYNQGLSSLPISGFVGLKESDELGQRVFVESILHSPGKYFGAVATGSLKSLSNYTTEIMYPTAASIAADPVATENFVQVNESTYRLNYVPNSGFASGWASSEPFIWKPGFEFFSKVETWGWKVSRFWTVVLITAGFLIAVWHALRYGWSAPALAMMVVFVSLAIFVVFSNMLLGFRWKEFRFVYPLVATLVAITLTWAIPELVRAIARLWRRPAPAATGS